MAIPHQIFKQLAKKRLIGKEGKEKEREIRKLLSEMPGYKTGPYGEIRKWLGEQIQENQKRSRAKARMFFDVKKEGDAQVMLLGPPNIGKSSLLKKLSSIQIKVADYQFTTLKPIPTIVDFGGAHVQIVEIPGLVQGATEGKGGGRAMLSAARNANYLVLMTSVDTPLQKVREVSDEMQRADLPRPRFIICNKIDLPQGAEAVQKIRSEFSGLEIVPISVETSEGVEELKETIWRNLQLIQVFPKKRSEKGKVRPIVLSVGATVQNFVDEMPSGVAERFNFAKVWGPSAKFPGQQAGLEHVLSDGDTLELH
jgi:small GTP-binding protein